MTLRPNNIDSCICRTSCRTGYPPNKHYCINSVGIRKPQCSTNVSGSYTTFDAKRAAGEAELEGSLPVYFETKRHIRYITQYEQAKKQINHTHPGDSEFFLITTFFKTHENKTF